MSENNLPIKLVLPKTTDIVPNIGGGDLKFFGKVTPELKKGITDKFEELLSFYSDVFDENEAIPAVGKITVKPEAIAKSHKPSDLCRNCRIIGSEDLDEIYIKVDRKNIHKTIEMVENPPSQKFQANMTAILNRKKKFHRHSSLLNRKTLTLLVSLLKLRSLILMMTLIMNKFGNM